MELDAALHGIGLIFQVFLLDLVLSGDNAMVIALAFRSLPPGQVKQAMVIGTGAAIGMRVLLTSLVGLLMQIPLLKVVGGVWLIVIAIRLLIEEEQEPQSVGDQAPRRLWSAVTTVLAADLVMSLDNVVALAAVSQGSTVYLVLGLMLSVPLLMFGSQLMAYLLHRYPILIPAGGAFLGYIAGAIAMSDPVLADGVRTQSPALTVLAPLLCAVFVVAESRIIEGRRAQLPRPVRPRITPGASVQTASTIGVSALEILSNTPSSSPQPFSGDGLIGQDSAHGSSIVSSGNPAYLFGIPPPMLAVAAVTIVVAIISTALWKGLTRISEENAINEPLREDAAYVCPGGVATVYYRHDGNSIRMVSSEGELNGYVNNKNEITWSSLQTSTSTLHFTPPHKVESYAEKIALYGGSFSQIQCTLQQR